MLGLWGTAPRQKFTKMGENMLRTNTPNRANFTAVGQMVYDKNVT